MTGWEHELAELAARTARLTTRIAEAGREHQALVTEHAHATVLASLAGVRGSPARGVPQ
ncbi:hypothetical protein [Nonomuraea sp. NPDC050540]|uniref:hypothetical protein n=1 Tax=Nonomuraea sp. NPDC050540 TaxID=3364367 RepID=UPI0037BB63A5